MHGYIDYYQLRDKIVGLKSDIKLSNFPGFILLTILFVLCFVSPILIFPTLWIKIVCMVAVSAFYIWLMYLISKDKDHVKKLRELEEKRYNEVAEIVQKDINEYEEKYSSRPYSFFSSMFKDEIEDLKTRYKNFAATAFVSSFITALVSSIQTGLEYFVAKSNLAEAQNLFDSLSLNAEETDEYIELLANASDSLEAAKKVYESAENAFAIACIVVFAVILLITVVNAVESIIKPFIYDKIKNLRYAYYILDEMKHNDTATAGTDKDAPIVGTDADKKDIEKTQCCQVCIDVLAAYSQKSPSVQDMIELLNAVNGVVSQNNPAKQQKDNDSSEDVEEKVASDIDVVFEATDSSDNCESDPEPDAEEDIVLPEDGSSDTEEAAMTGQSPEDSASGSSEDSNAEEETDGFSDDTGIQAVTSEEYKSEDLEKSEEDEAEKNGKSEDDDNKDDDADLTRKDE